MYKYSSTIIDIININSVKLYYLYYEIVLFSVYCSIINIDNLVLI